MVVKFINIDKRYELSVPTQLIFHMMRYDYKSTLPTEYPITCVHSQKTMSPIISPLKALPYASIKTPCFTRILQ